MEKKFINYNTIREDFNIYECENGQILKTKHVLVELYEKYEKNQTVADAGFKDISMVITPKPIDTSDLVEAKDNELTEEHEVKELKFKIIKETINLYETDKLIMMIDAKVEKIMLTNRKDFTGAPYLRFRTGLAMNVVPKRPEEKVV